MSKQNKNRDRREMVEEMRRKARAAERRRTLSVLAVCVVVALIIVGLAGFKLYQDNQEKAELAKRELTDIGAQATAAGCSPIEEVDATGTGDHVTTPVDYDSTPPNSGPHNPSPVEGGIHFYGPSERPEVERLVHNLEHGWTIVWYDENVADDDSQMNQLEATAEKFDAQGADPRYNMIIAPWTEDDGGAFPEGKHITFSHWSVHQPTYDPEFFEQGDIDTFGVSQYCDTFSGGALDSFMKRYPYDDAPEGYLWHG